MNILITTLGRGHFIDVASSIIRAGVDATLFQGWIVKKPRQSVLLKIVSKIVGRDSVIYGFERRTMPELEGRNIGDFWSEAVQWALVFTIGRVSRWLFNFSVKVGFYIHGYRTMRLLKHGHYTIAHIKSGLGQGGAITYAKSHGTKVLVDHSAGAPQYIIEQVDGRKWGSWSFWWTVMQDCDEADLLMVTSDFVKSTFVRYGYPAEKIRVVYMGLNSDFNGLKKWRDDELVSVGRDPAHPLKIVFTGPFAPHKGNKYFLQAIDLLVKQGVSMDVTVMGVYHLTKEEQIAYRDVIKMIRFAGHLTQDEKKQRLCGNHLYLFPSLSEGCAKSAFEAMSIGLCVVATAETGLPIEDGEDGFLVPARNGAAIAAKIEVLLSHPETMMNAGKMASEKLSRYTWDAYAQNVINAYRELESVG